MITVTLPNCVECGAPVEGRASYCSRACIQRAYRKRHPRLRQGIIPISPEQAKRLQIKIRALKASEVLRPEGMLRRRWDEIRHGELTELTYSELRLITTVVPGALFALGMTVDRYA